MMFRLFSKRTVRRSALLSMGGLLVLLLTQTSAMAADVTALFQQARSLAVQLNRDAATMESFTRSNLSWQTHSGQITTIREHINNAGSILSQMQAARGDAKPWHQDAIDGISPLLKQMASNTDAIITHLNENPRRLRDPNYVAYVRSNSQSARQLSAAIGNIVDFDNTRNRMEELAGKLGQ
ncbi:MAG TPA: hypothetical protein VKB77_02405 [Terriglobales bacterium]|nr:hypothetical protein [Terriglobales bacterium]